MTPVIPVRIDVSRLPVTASTVYKPVAVLTKSVTSASVKARTLASSAVFDEMSISGRGAPVFGSIVVWSTVDLSDV